MRCVPLLIILLSPASAWCAQVYNYEAFGNTLDGPLGTPSGTCTAESYVSEVLAVSDCSSAPGVLTSARSFATFTTLKAESSITLTDAVLPSGLAASGYARLQDYLAVDSAAVSSVSLTMHLTGSITNNGLSLARMVLSFGFDYEGRVFSASVCAMDVAAGTRAVDMMCTTGAYPIALFEQHPYWFSLSTQERENVSTTPVSGFASSDFFSTATLVSVAPYDSNGQFVADAVISSEGNGGTPFAIVETPEPETAGLFACAFMIIGSFRYARSNRARRF